MNEDKTELSLFVGNNLYCTIKHKKKGHQMDDFEVLCIIDDIEYQQNFTRNKAWMEYLAK